MARSHHRDARSHHEGADPATGSKKLRRGFGWIAGLGGVLVLANWLSSSRYVIGCFFSLALLFDGPGLLATGLGGRRVVGLMTADDESKHVQPE